MQIELMMKDLLNFQIKMTQGAMLLAAHYVDDVTRPLQIYLAINKRIEVWTASKQKRVRIAVSVTCRCPRCLCTC